MKFDKDPQPWEVLHSEYLFRRPWLTARRDHVRLPSGAENKEYYVLEYYDWVNIIARDTEGRFVMLRQYRHGLGQTCLEICAGTMDQEGETPEETARRELLEETGYGGGEWRLHAVLSGNASSTSNRTYCFVAEGVERIDTQHLEPTEEITVHLLSEEEVRACLENDEVKQALMAASLWKYFAQKAGK